MWNQYYTWDEFDYIVQTTNHKDRGLHPNTIQRCFYDAKPLARIAANG
jgi:hypothetical protein